MVRIDSKAKFTPNGEELKKIREILNLPKSKMGDFFKSYGVKKLGDRVYISIENGQKTEMKKIYDIAYAFNKEFKNFVPVIFMSGIKSFFFNLKSNLELIIS